MNPRLGADGPVRIAIAGALWDTIVDSLEADCGRRLGREGAWLWVKVGFGHQAQVTVDRPTADYVAKYLESFAGLMAQTWAADVEERATMRRESAAAQKGAFAIRRQLEALAERERPPRLVGSKMTPDNLQTAIDK